MDRNGVFVTVFLLHLLIVDCYAVEKDINSNKDSGSVVDPKIGNQSGEKLSKTGSNSDTVKAEEGKETGLSSGASEGRTEKGSAKQHDLAKLSSDGNGTGGKEEGGMSKNSGVDGGKEKGRATEGLGSNDAKDGSSKGGDSKSSRKENSRPEECDASFSCKDDKNKLVACLQVPGNESPDLSLLIQNRGTESLTVTITAPSVVNLEKTTVQLPKNEDEKVVKDWGLPPSHATLEGAEGVV
ncbi:hypothetical protein ACLOJK_010187 [Asimina triloba]